ncbi:MAG: GlsB/YeaQ/YmgE family stress response membrane protein [Ardenticatenaceae bacterium]|nr:GlsB/YeaQ/YmgE family stress response membrane protein [Ardenticatenaceae bacterium]MCB9445343.1 GlsB/YeaQ/YmgE family stress response membrane protein [Ardenticatenaceae bacterium]
MQFIIWLISGIIAGWLTGQVMKGSGFGLIGDLIVGILGGVVGGFVAGLFGLAATSWIGNILVAVLGGVILVAIIHALRRV